MWILYASALLCRWMLCKSKSKWIVFIIILFAHVELGCGVCCFAHPFPNTSRLRLAMASSNSACGSEAIQPAGLERFGPQQSTCCPYNVDPNQKHLKPRSPLDGAYCVEMLPESEKDRRLYDKEVSFDVCKYLRHQASKFGKLRM